MCTKASLMESENGRRQPAHIANQPRSMFRPYFCPFPQRLFLFVVGDDE